MQAKVKLSDGHVITELVPEEAVISKSWVTIDDLKSTSASRNDYRRSINSG